VPATVVCAYTSAGAPQSGSGQHPNRAPVVLSGGAFVDSGRLPCELDNVSPFVVRSPTPPGMGWAVVSVSRGAVEEAYAAPAVYWCGAYRGASIACPARPVGRSKQVPEP